MNILSLFKSFVNHFTNILDNNLLLHELESRISTSTYELNLDMLKTILEYIDLEYKHSKERKEKYYVQATRSRTLITSLGLLTFNKTYYVSKEKTNDKHIYFSYLEDYLSIDKWAKMTLKAEVNLVNNSVDNGISWASKNTIPGYITSRQTISKKIKNINYNYAEEVTKNYNPPTVLYIEADEVHSNLQNKGRRKKNKIVPVILTHEGHKEDFVNKKELKNTHYVASSILKTDKLWREAYKYLDSKYDLEKVKYLFISGDGGAWIKNYVEAFPNAIYVFDKFHYYKALNYLFKNDTIKKKIADSYLRYKMVNDFKLLVESQITNYPDSEKYMKQKMKLLLNNIDGIINQRHPFYKCPASMEGHISNKYAKYLTSRPHSYSKEGLENTVQLLTMKANNITLTEEIYHNFKYGESTYKKINLEKFISHFKLSTKKIITNTITTHDIDNYFFSPKDNYRLDYFLNKRV